MTYKRKIYLQATHSRGNFDNTNGQRYSCGVWLHDETASDYAKCTIPFDGRILYHKMQVYNAPNFGSWFQYLTVNGVNEQTIESAVNTTGTFEDATTHEITAGDTISMKAKDTANSGVMRGYCTFIGEYD